MSDIFSEARREDKALLYSSIATSIKGPDTSDAPVRTNITDPREKHILNKCMRSIRIMPAIKKADYAAASK